MKLCSINYELDESTCSINLCRIKIEKLSIQCFELLFKHRYE